MRRVKVVHVVAGLWRDTGGPAEVIPNLCRAQAAAGAEVILCTIDGDIAPQVRQLEGSGVVVRIAECRDRRIRYSPALSKFLREVDGVTCIHNHGHWLYPNWIAAYWAKKRRIPLVSTPHGTLVSSMLRRSRIKKKVAWALFDRRLVKTSSVIHALSGAEAAEISARLAGMSKRVEVIPNGVRIPRSPRAVSKGPRKTLLFLSRLAEIKGVRDLFDAWLSVESHFPDWDLTLVGPVEREIRQALQEFLRSAKRATFVGPAYGDERWKYFDCADGFVLPTYGEGLPTALLEAAAYGLPILTTKGANFPQLFAAGGAIACEAGNNGLRAGLGRLLSLSRGELEGIGQSGRRLVSQDYDWTAIGKTWVKLYGALGAREPVCREAGDSNYHSQ